MSEEDPTRMNWVLDAFEQELLWALNMAEFVISEEIERLIQRRIDTTIRRAILFAATKVNQLSPYYQAGEGWLPLDEQILDDQVKLALEELEEATPDEQRIRLVARTCLMRTFNTTAKKRYEAFGITRYRYIAHAGACTDPKELADGTIVEGGCAELGGQEFPIDDDVHVPPIHPNCRCTIVPVMEGEEHG